MISPGADSSPLRKLRPAVGRSHVWNVGRGNCRCRSSKTECHNSCASGSEGVPRQTGMLASPRSDCSALLPRRLVFPLARSAARQSSSCLSITSGFART